mgnify:CR=1 FL=1|tara:strand:+ start:7121 stop:8203 length:1083 start_codon:yes stop_codon:yes gene_type:complete
MRQPFSLEQQVADQISTSEDMMKDRYVSDMTQTGTKAMKNLIEKMQKKAQKGAGLFKGKFGKLLKTGLNIGSTFLGPWGKVAKLVLTAADAAKRQKDLKKMQKDIKSMGGVPAQFKGTFLENYLKGGAESSKAQLGEMLKGRKKAAGISDLIALGGDLISVGKVAPELSSSLKGAGAKVKDVAQDVGQKVGQKAKDTFQSAKDKTMQQLKKGEMGYFPQDSDSDKILNRLFAKTEKGITDYGGPGDASAEVIQGGAEKLTPAISRDVIGGQTFEASDFSQKIAALAEKAGGKSIPFMGGATFDKLNQPLMGLGGDSALGQAIFTPSNYAPLAQDLYMNYLTQPAGEPVITEAQGPSRRYY